MICTLHGESLAKYNSAYPNDRLPDNVAKAVVTLDQAGDALDVSFFDVSDTEVKGICYDDGSLAHFAYSWGDCVAS